MKQTLWEYLHERKPNLASNPLNLTGEHFIDINVPAYSGMHFHVKDILLYIREIGPKAFTHVDYLLQSAEREGELRLRVMDGERSFLILEELDSFPFDENFQTVIDDAIHTGFRIDEENKIFYREIQEPYLAKIQRNSDLLTWQSSYWDFIGDGFVFVERREHDGWFTVFRGFEVLPSDILII